MAIGFIIASSESYNGTGGNIQVIPDNVMNRTSTPKTLKVSFGDGYEQRAATGLNALKETYMVTFNNRLKAEADDIISFFKAKKGISSFLFTVPDSNSGGSEDTVKVLCENYSTNFVNSNFYSISAQFRRVYE